MDVNLKKMGQTSSLIFFCTFKFVIVSLAIKVSLSFISYSLFWRTDMHIYAGKSWCLYEYLVAFEYGEYLFF